MSFSTMASTRRLVYRVRVPVPTSRSTRRLRGTGLRRSMKGCRRGRRGMRGGFLPALVPIIAAAVGAIPGIASVALQASRKD